MHALLKKSELLKDPKAALVYIKAKSFGWMGTSEWAKKAEKPPILASCQSFKPHKWSLTVPHTRLYWHGLFQVKCLNYRFTKVIHRRLLIPFVGIGFSRNACIAVSWKTYMFETALTALNYTEKNMSPLSSMEMGKMNAFCSWKMMKLTLIF